MIDLMIMDFAGYDFILGMDFLTRYGVVLDCANRRVHIAQAGWPELVYDCDSHSDTIFSSALYSLEVTGPSISDIPIVKDYADVFEEVSGLPPVREVNFRIDLVPGAAPISKPAYRLAPKQLEELKKQLDELLEKG